MIEIYRPPSAKNVLYDKWNTFLKDRDTNNEIILLGDFNINWNDGAKRKELK